MKQDGKKYFITGGAGFIGSAVARYLIGSTLCDILVYDKLTYAGSLESLSEVASSPRYRFVHGDVCDKESLWKVIEEYQPDVVMHLAAESHVDRSISGPYEFIRTNILGTFEMLDVTLRFWNSLSIHKKETFRFLHISTDEVYGSLDGTELFTEKTAYDPSSPYSASKASSDHLVSAWSRTYGLPVLITNCSNNYGAYQFPEKLIPLMIFSALSEKPLKIYGDGMQVRDWLFVDDHAEALCRIVTHGKIGEKYNIGGHNEKTNLEVVYSICDLLDELHPPKSLKLSTYRNLIEFVEDRPGHDQRYAIDATKIQKAIGWLPHETFESGLRKTVEWYLKNTDWCNK